MIRIESAGLRENDKNFIPRDIDQLLLGLSSEEMSVAKKCSSFIDAVGEERSFYLDDFETDIREELTLHSDLDEVKNDHLSVEDDQVKKETALKYFEYLSGKIRSFIALLSDYGLLVSELHEGQNSDRTATLKDELLKCEQSILEIVDFLTSEHLKKEYRKAIFVSLDTTLSELGDEIDETDENDETFEHNVAGSAYRDGIKEAFTSLQESSPELASTIYEYVELMLSLRDYSNPQEVELYIKKKVFNIFREGCLGRYKTAGNYQVFEVEAKMQDFKKIVDDIFNLTDQYRNFLKDTNSQSTNSPTPDTDVLQKLIKEAVQKIASDTYTDQDRRVFSESLAEATDRAFSSDEDHAEFTPEQVEHDHEIREFQTAIQPIADIYRSNISKHIKVSYEALEGAFPNLSKDEIGLAVFISEYVRGKIDLEDQAKDTTLSAQILDSIKIMDAQLKTTLELAPRVNISKDRIQEIISMLVDYLI